MRQSSKIGRLPRPLGDMPAVFVDSATHVLGGGGPEEIHGEILRVELNGRVQEVGRLPEGVRGHQAVVVDGAVFVLGGFTGGTRDTVLRLDPKGWRATRVAPMPHDAAWFSATVAGRRIWVVGGFSIPHGYWTDMAAYDVDKDRWETIYAAFPGDLFSRGRLGSNATVAVGDRILSFGGADQFDPEHNRANALGVAAQYDVVKRQWRPLPTRIQPREGLVAARTEGAAYLVGGMPEGAERPLALVERVDLESGAVEPFGTLSTGRLTPGVGTGRAAAGDRRGDPTAPRGDGGDRVA
jgi:N-acetylneuraminic acid mutarotase